MYEQLFETKLLTLGFMLGFSVFVGVAVSTASIGLRSLIYNFVPSIAVAFYAVALISPEPANTLDLTAGLLFELLVLAVFVRCFADVHQLTHRLTLGEASRALLSTLPVQLLISWPVMSLDNFGIFAEGSRIAFLSEAAWAKYLTYGSVLLSAVQAPLVARLVTLRGKVPALAWSTVLINAAISTLGGSKGAIFLWLLAVAALVDWRAARLRLRTIVLVLTTTVAGFVASVMFLSSQTGMEPDEFLTLAFSRFLVTNDARSMAFDLRTDATGSMGMLRETLRSFSNLFGLAPKQDPLGSLLYQQVFGQADGTGANASLMAVATFYMTKGSVLLPAAIAAAVLLLMVMVARGILHSLGSGFGALLLSVTALICVGLYSQDILAFQILAPLAVLIFAIVVTLHRMRVKRVSRSALANP